MRNVLAFIGGATIVLGFIGAIGIGDFVFFYGGSAEQWCHQKYSEVKQ